MKDINIVVPFAFEFTANKFLAILNLLFKPTSKLRILEVKVYHYVVTNSWYSEVCE